MELQDSFYFACTSKLVAKYMPLLIPLEILNRAFLSELRLYGTPRASEISRTGSKLLER